ncbi:MAG: alpha/beta hydrolase [Gammaproteobacteria bacterium]
MSKSTSEVCTASPVELGLVARGLTLSALAFGDSSRTPMIALHGWLDNAASFLQLAPLLEQYYVVALDLPGHGKSDARPLGGSYFHADYALDVAHAADALGFESFVLLGHSMGGGVATLVAAAMPERVTHLLLIDGLGPYSDSVEKTAHQLGRAVAQSLSSSQELRRYTSLEELFARRAAVSKDIADDALRPIVERNAVQREDESGQSYWQWSTDPRLKLASPTRLTHEGVLHLLAEIKSPVLNLLATTGMMMGFPEIKKRTGRLVNAKTVNIEGHHHFHLDGPVSQVAEMITGFVSAVPPFGRVE